MLIKKRFDIENKFGDHIIGDIRQPEIDRKVPAVLLLHGFKGFKDWGFFPYLSERIAERGAITLCFNFSLNGMREGSDLVSSIDDFARNTVSREQSDVLEVIENFSSGVNEFGSFPSNWNGEIFLLGHSLGGAISLLAAERCDAVSKAALWGTISTFQRYSQRQKIVWEKLGYFEFLVAKTGQTLRMNYDYLKDIEDNKFEYSLPRAAENLNKPLLIIHGKQDVTVALREPEAIYKASNKELTELFIVSRTGHTFGIDHPFAETCEPLETALNKTISFFDL